MSKSKPVYTSPWSIRLPIEVAKEMRQHCDENFLTPSNYMRQAIINDLKNHEKIIRPKRELDIIPD